MIPGVVWWMTTKKAAKTTFFCDGVHTDRNPWICMRDCLNEGNKLVSELKYRRECITRRSERVHRVRKKVRNPPSTRLVGTFKVKSSSTIKP